MTPEERQALTQKLRGGAPENDGVIRLPADCRVLAVASGKGGVGKSSLAANLAVAFSGLATASVCSTRTSTATRSAHPRHPAAAGRR